MIVALQCTNAPDDPPLNTRVISSVIPMRKKHWPFCIVLVALLATALAEMRFQPVKPEVIKTRLRAFAGNDFDREARLKSMFADEGCKPDDLT